MTVKLIAPVVRYHRNGSGGESFHVVDFKWGRGDTGVRLRAIVFENRDAVSVTNPADIGDHYDGPYFEDALRALIAKAAADPRTYDRS